MNRLHCVYNELLARAFPLAAFLLIGLIPIGSAVAQGQVGSVNPRIEQVKRLMARYDETPLVTPYGWVIVGNKHGRDGHRRGIVALDGTKLLPVKYDYIIPQRNCRLVVVVKGSRMGILNSQLQWLLPMEYDCGNMAEEDGNETLFVDGMLSVKKGGKHGLIDTNGNWLRPCLYDHGLRPISDKLIATDSSVNEYAVRAGIINYAGDTILPFQYSGFGSICDGRGCVTRGDRLGYIDQNGRIAIPIQYETRISYSFCHGLVPVPGKDENGNDKWGVIDTLGRVVVPFAYDLIHDNGPSGLFYASKGRGLQGEGAINRKNEVVVPFEYAVRNDESSDRIAFKNFTMSQLLTVQAQPTDVYDTLGNLVAQYEDWDGGLGSQATMIAVKKDGLWGFLDSTFRMIIPCQYPSASSLGDYGIVELGNGNNALVDSRGDTLAQGPFHYLYSAGMGLYRVSSGPNRYQQELEGYVDSSGNHTFTPQQWHQLHLWWKER